MVGLAVGIVENGRITFLNGYGETLEGIGRAGDSGNGVPLGLGFQGRRRRPWPPSWPSRGSSTFTAPIATYGTSLRLPGGDEYRATLGDVLSHRLGIYRNAWDDKLEAGEDPRVIRQSIGTLGLAMRAGKLLELSEHRVRRVERGGRQGKRQILQPSGARHAVRADRHDLGEHDPGRAAARQQLGPAAQRRPSPAGGQRRLLPRPRRRRRQQQHQGHGAVDDRADGRNARRAQSRRC